MSDMDDILIKTSILSDYTIKLVYIGDIDFTHDDLVIGNIYYGRVFNDSKYQGNFSFNVLDYYYIDGSRFHKKSIFKTLEEIRDDKIISILDNE